MLNVILFDNETRDHLLPLTFTRPVCELRLGILTIREKWERHLDAKASYITQDYLSEKYPITISDDNLVINGGALPSEPLLHLITQLENNEALLQNEELIAARLNAKQFERLMHDEEIDELKGYEVGDTPFLKVEKLWDLFTQNDQALNQDFLLLTKNRSSQPLSETNTVIGNRQQIFLEEGAKVEGATLNSNGGSIYIGQNAEIMEGSMIRGGVAICQEAVVKMGAKIYGATTIGPNSKAGGEIKNSIIIANSSKGHEGYLGNSVLGEWCNIGADTNNSNLKNNYADVRLWDYPTESFAKTGQQFCGLIMGDHSKCGINTMFNTGTVVGVFANIFGSGFPRNFIPSFAWGGASGFSTYQTPKAFEVAELVMQRRKKDFDSIEKSILHKVFEDTSKFRRWEKVSAS